MLKLASLTFFVRNLQQASKFYQKGLQLTHISQDDNHILLRNPRTGIFLGLQQSTQESQLSTSYSPIINFEMESGLNETIYKLIEMGANLDGHVLYEVHGNSATLRTPDGHMIGLYEANPDISITT